MGLLDDLKGKAQGLVRGNEQAIKDGITKAGDFVDSKTGGKYSSHVNKVQTGASTLVDKANKRPTQAPVDNVPPAGKAP